FMKEKKSKRGIGSTNLNSQDNTKRKSSEGLFLLNLIKEMSKRLRDEYEFSDEQLYEAFVKGKEEETLLIPVSIFSTKLAPAEALIKYLKETHDINYHEISILINRNERGVWASYQRAIKKMPSKFEIRETIFVPVSIFADNNFSILECLISYLKDVKHMKNSKIAILLNKNPSNIWTIYNRAKTKKGALNE
ncbi:hypothetical protein JYT91_01110, partial [archaeon AH-315-M20]|nr:hypothetical protein [archaeon AH-315-M20]